MRTFCHDKLFVLLFWIIYGQLIFDDPQRFMVSGQQQPPSVVAFGPPGVIGLPPSQPQQPCDRTRRVFTETYGEISDGPAGYNYTQVWNLSLILYIIYRLYIDRHLVSHIGIFLSHWFVVSQFVVWCLVFIFDNIFLLAFG